LEVFSDEQKITEKRLGIFIKYCEKMGLILEHDKGKYSVDELIWQIIKGLK